MEDTVVQKLVLDLNQGHTNTFLSWLNDKFSSICFTLNNERSQWFHKLQDMSVSSSPRSKGAFLFHAWLYRCWAYLLTWPVNLTCILLQHLHCMTCDIEKECACSCMQFITNFFLLHEQRQLSKSLHTKIFFLQKNNFISLMVNACNLFFGMCWYC